MSLFGRRTADLSAFLDPRFPPPPTSPMLGLLGTLLLFVSRSF